jgi:trimeric autotransporter adhesin
MKGLSKLANVIGILMLGLVACQKDSQLPDSYVVSDQAFEKVLVARQIDSDGTVNGQISRTDAEKVTEIDLYNEGIASLNGIEGFVNLSRLFCEQNALTTLDLTRNTKLIKLNCAYNQLRVLDVSQLNNLQELNCSSNELTQLDVSRNQSLSQLMAARNKLNSIDLSQNQNLVRLSVAINRVGRLDVSKNAQLETLHCGENLLGSLDVGNNKLLWQLQCNDNNLQRLELSQNPALRELFCGGNPLTELNLCNQRQLLFFNSFNSNVPFIYLNTLSQPTTNWLKDAKSQYRLCP